MDQIELLKTPDYSQIKIAFFDELTRASHEEPSSISYLKHYLPDQPLVSKGIVQGIVIGGTNYIISVEEIQEDGGRKILDRRTGVLPLLKDEEVFFAFIDEHIDSRATGIGLNFAFRLDPTQGIHGELDGILINGGKEHALTGLAGKAIGKEVNNIFMAKFGRDIPVAVANDTVCLILAGDTTENGSMIAGTGFNLGLKINEGGRKAVVNLQAGSFNKFEQSEVLKKIDAQSTKPGSSLFEKIISGKYLAEVFNMKADRMGLTLSQVKTSQELSALSHEATNHDANKLARILLERSAFLVATSLAAIYEFSGKPESFTIIGEGSLLWKGWQYTENIEKQLELLGIPQDAIKIKHVQNSSINGAIGLLL